METRANKRKENMSDRKVPVYLDKMVGRGRWMERIRIKCGRNIFIRKGIFINICERLIFDTAWQPLRD